MTYYTTRYAIQDHVLNFEFPAAASVLPDPTFNTSMYYARILINGKSYDDSGIGIPKDRNFKINETINSIIIMFAFSNGQISTIFPVININNIANYASMYSNVYKFFGVNNTYNYVDPKTVDKKTFNSGEFTAQYNDQTPKVINLLVTSDVQYLLVGPQSLIEPMKSGDTYIFEPNTSDASDDTDVQSLLINKDFYNNLLNISWIDRYFGWFIIILLILLFVILLVGIGAINAYEHYKYNKI